MSLLPRSGRMVGGVPISYNVAPSADLTRHVARFFVTAFDQPDGQITTDFVLAENAFVRVLVRGEWEAETSPGIWQAFHGPIFFGAQAKRLNVRVRGPAAMAGFAIRPGAWRCFFKESASLYADKLLPLREHWPEADELKTSVAAAIDDYERAIELLQAAVRRRLRLASGQDPDSAMEDFDHVARIDPTREVGAIAGDLNLSLKQLHGRVLQSFGHSPKAVLRRARFLDLAAALRRITFPGEEELAMLRFYDQSHLTRELRRFVDMTPAQFERTPTPVLTISLEARECRKAEDERRVGPGALPPWRSRAA